MRHTKRQNRKMSGWWKLKPHIFGNADQAMKHLLYRLFLSSLVLGIAVNSHAFGTNNQFGESVSEPEFLKVDQAFQFSERIVEGGVKLNWQVTEGYYLYLERFKFKSLDNNAELGTPEFSSRGERKEDPYFGEVHVIHDDLDVFVPLSLATGKTESELKITYQGCAEAGLCYPPTHKRILYIPVDGSSSAGANSSPNTGSKQDTGTAARSTISPISLASDASARSLDNADGVFAFIQDSSLVAIVGIFFLLGIGLTFTPCVFPMIPIITSIIAGQQNPTVLRSLILSLSYVLGMAITYAAAGVITGMLGAGANVQAALQDPVLLSVFAGIFVMLAMAMFGLYELQLPAFLRDRLNTTSQNLTGGHIGSVFGIGALSALVVSPCVSAPLAGALLYISATADGLIGGLSLFALGMGMGVPLILISVGGGKLFPKAGKWMDTVKAVFGVMLIAVAIWLIGRFAPPALTMALWAVLLGLSAVQMGAFDPAAPGWPRLFKGTGILMAFYSALLIVGATSGGHDPLRPLAGSQLQRVSGNLAEAAQPTSTFTIIQSMPQLTQQLEQAQSLRKPVMVDFYADWCISCKVMESQVFPQPDIAARMKQFHLVKADVTQNDQANQTLMNRFGLFGPPSILFFDPDGTEMSHLRIVGEVTASDFRQRLDQALLSAQPAS